MAVIIFFSGGLELEGIIIVEVDNLAHGIPKTTNQVIYRVIIF